jgi:hypothetical protein
VRLSYQIPIVTGVILVSTLIVNVFSFQNTLQNLFPKYLSRVETESSTSQNNQLDALVRIGQLDSEEQKEYTAVISELSNLSTALKNISENPELYFATGSTPGPDAISLGNISENLIHSAKNKNIADIFINPTTFVR